MWRGSKVKADGIIEAEEPQLVELAMTHDRLEVRMIRGLLESEGIESIPFLGRTGRQIASEGSGMPFRASGARIMVAAVDAEKAFALLERRQEENRD
jgi:Putative prokaryotic signal transducing protein